MTIEVDRRIELLECEVWDVVRGSIETGATVRVMEAASRIAAAHQLVMSVAEVAQILADAAVAAGLPVEVEGLPPTVRDSGGRAHRSDSVRASANPRSR